MWIILLVGFLFLSTYQRLGARIIAEKYPQYSHTMVLFFYVFLLPIGLGLQFFLPNSFQDATVWEMLFVVVGSALWPIAGVVGYKSNVTLGAGLFTIINNFAPVVAIILGFVLLGESLTSLQLLGAGLLIMAPLIAVYTKSTLENVALVRGIWWAFLATLIAGVATVYEKYALSLMDIGAYILLSWNAQAIFMLLMNLRTLPVLHAFAKDKAAIRQAAPYMLAAALKSPMFLGMLALASASIVSPSSRLVAVFVVVASYFYLNEKDHLLQKVVASIVGVVGLILIAT